SLKVSTSLAGGACSIAPSEGSLACNAACACAAAALSRRIVSNHTASRKTRRDRWKKEPITGFIRLQTSCRSAQRIASCRSMSARGFQQSQPGRRLLQIMCGLAFLGDFDPALRQPSLACLNDEEMEGAACLEIVGQPPTDDELVKFIIGQAATAPDDLDDTLGQLDPMADIGPVRSEEHTSELQ